MQLNPYLSFDGRCEEAFKFYEQCLGGKIVAMMTFGGSPMEGQTPSRMAQQDHACAAYGRRRGIDGFRRPARAL